MSSLVDLPWGRSSIFGIRGSSLTLVGLLLSSCEACHSTYFRKLISICGRVVLSRCDVLGESTLVFLG